MSDGSILGKARSGGVVPPAVCAHSGCRPSTVPAVTPAAPLRKRRREAPVVHLRDLLILASRMTKLRIVRRHPARHRQAPCFDNAGSSPRKGLPDGSRRAGWPPAWGQLAAVDLSVAVAAE